ncbi:MAG: hypothetical protein AVDCRST_MAG38-819, partial [uncultured Solirubrobacteraceae bacterium]
EANRNPHRRSGRRRRRHDRARRRRAPGGRRRAGDDDRGENRQAAGLRDPPGHGADRPRRHRRMALPRRPRAPRRDQPRQPALPQLSGDAEGQVPGPLPQVRHLSLPVHHPSQHAREGRGRPVRRAAAAVGRL